MRHDKQKPMGLAGAMGGLPLEAPRPVPDQPDAPPPARADAVAEPRAPGMAPDQAAGGEPASPEEQAQYEQFVNNAYELIYDEQAIGKVLEGLQGDGNPQDGLAFTAANIVAHLEASAEQSGAPLAEGVVFNAGVEILEDLANLAGHAGIHDFSEEEVEGALYKALDVYREVKGAMGGGVDQEGAAAELEMLMAADQEGRLGQAVPGMDEAVQRLGQRRPPAGEGEPA
jgi:hypothetical protein